jgi:parallel beta-helix repeat protein
MQENSLEGKEKLQKHISEMVIVLLLISILSSAFNIQLIKAVDGTIYIRADGSVDPSSAPIFNVGNVSYTFTADISEPIVVERDNIVVDGAGHMLLGAGSESGISLTGRSNVTIKNITIRAFEYGIYLNGSSGNTLSANRISNNTYSIFLDSSSNNGVSANYMANNTYYGIYFINSSNNGVSANNITNNGYGILLDSSSNNGVSANYIANNTYYGIELYSASYNSISANNITNNNGYGIYLYSSSNNGVSANYIANNTYYGIELYYYSNSNSISANIITNNNGHGIYLYSSSNNSISANTVTNHDKDGILLDYSSYNSISANNITNNNWLGIYLHSSSYSNSISANNLTNNYYGIELYYSSYNNSILANTITNNNYFGIHLISSSYNTMSGNNVTNNKYYGIFLEYSSYNSVSANYMANNTYGIALSSSLSNIMSANTVKNNTYGIELYYYSDSNSVCANNITNNYRGIWLHYYSTNNGVSANNITNNYYGIELDYSANNFIRHNNFVDNAAQATVSPLESVNVWDDGYPSGGNYWSDYSGVDLYKGPSQNVPGSDGIGDTPYVIDANNTDRYPLMNPWKPSLAVGNVVAWRWGGNTTVTCVAAGDVDGDGASEIVTGGFYFDGVRNVALLHVWNGSTLSVERSVPWFWGGDTVVTSLAVGDVDGDGNMEIVTGGYYFDGVRNVAQLHVWDGATLAVKKVQTWYWGGNTTVNCLAIEDVDGDGQKEIVTGGQYFDGTRTVALLHVWNGATLAVKKAQPWYWSGDTTVNCLVVGDLYGDGASEIVTGGYYFDGVRRVAQLHVWNGATLAVKDVTTWCWGGSTEISSVCIGDVDGDGASEIVTGGFYFDGVRNVALLHVWNAALAVERAVPWYWGGDTKALSVALGDVDCDGKTEVVTGGYYFDGVERVAQLHVWDGENLGVKDVKTWYWAGDTLVDSMVVSDVNNDLLSEIVTGGTFYYGSHDNAQLMEWTMT